MISHEFLLCGLVFFALGVGQLNLIGVQLEKKSQRFTLTHLRQLNLVGVFFTLHCLPVLESKFSCLDDGIVFPDMLTAA